MMHDMYAPSDSVTVDGTDRQRHGGAADAHDEDAGEHPHLHGDQLVCVFAVLVVVFAVLVVVVIVRIHVGVQVHHMVVVHRMSFVHSFVVHALLVVKVVIIVLIVLIVVHHQAGVVRQTEFTDLIAQALLQSPQHTPGDMSSLIRLRHSGTFTRQAAYSACRQHSKGNAPSSRR